MLFLLLFNVNNEEVEIEDKDEDEGIEEEEEGIEEEEEGIEEEDEEIVVVVGKDELGVFVVRGGKVFGGLYTL